MRFGGYITFFQTLPLQTAAVVARLQACPQHATTGSHSGGYKFMATPNSRNLYMSSQLNGIS